MSEREPGEPADPGDPGDPDEVAEVIEELAEHGDLPEADVIEQHQSIPGDVDEYDDEYNAE